MEDLGIHGRRYESDVKHIKYEHVQVYGVT
jgi:hypothetical protein